MRCNKCGMDNPPQEIYCQNCHAPLPIRSQNGIVCTTCGATNDPSAAYCIHCGASLYKQERQARYGTFDTAGSGMEYTNPPSGAGPYPDPGFIPDSGYYDDRYKPVDGTGEDFIRYNPYDVEPPAKKSKGMIIALCAAGLITLAAVGILGWAFWGKYNIGVDTQKVDEKYYAAYSTLDAYAKPFDTLPSEDDVYVAGNEVSITQTKERNGALWGKTKSDTWVLLQDNEHTYFFSENDLSMLKTDEETQYEIVQKPKFYYFPDTSCEEVSDHYDIGQTITIFSVYTNSGSGQTWGKYGTTNIYWVLIQDNDGEYLKKVSAKTSTSSSSTESNSTDDVEETS